MGEDGCECGDVDGNGMMRWCVCDVECVEVCGMRV